MANPAAPTVPPPTPGIAPSDGTSIDAAPDLVPEHTALALAKMRLIEAGRGIDPLKPLREHPYATVGIAGGLGAVLGSTGGTAAVALTGLVRSLTAMIGPLSSLIAPFIAGKVAAESTKDDAVEAVQNADASETSTPS